MPPRSNAEWLWALQGQQYEAQSEALHDLHDFLLRAVLVYLSQHRSELSDWSRQDIHDLAADLAQDALMEIRASLDRFRGESKFTTWAYRFVINRAVSELRRQRYHDLSLEQLQRDEPAFFQALLSHQARVELEQWAERRNYINLLREIIETELDERQRAAIVGVHWQGHSMDEVATAIGLTRNALYKLMHDARKRLKARLLARHVSLGDILAAFEDQW
jgi:RNA polymerase sigma-70 factor (ECF subfamily)